MVDGVFKPGDVLLPAREGSFLWGIVTSCRNDKCDVTFMTRGGGLHRIPELPGSFDHWLSAGAWKVMSHDDD